MGSACSGQGWVLRFGVADPDHPFLAQASARDRGPRYVLHGVLGRGTYGSVYAAFDRDLERMVAIKVLDRRWLGDPLEVDAFLGEARASARIDHAAVVPVYDVQYDSVPWFVMRRIVGTNLHDALMSETPTVDLRRPRSVAMIMLRVAEAVAAAHRLGIVHCDLKPANLLLGEHGEVWVADWGLSPSAEETVIRGTPAYMSPEQATGGRATVVWDVFALGTILHELLYGRPLLSGDDPEWWRRRRAGERDPVPVQVARVVPPPLRAIIDRAVAPVGDRYADAGLLADDLRAFLADEPVAALREGMFTVAARFARRHRAILATAAPLLLLASLLGWLLVGERIRTYAHWGVPIASAVSPGWIDLSGSFVQQADAVVATGPFLNQRALQRSCRGGIAVEYDASFAADQPEGDISIAFAAGFRPNAAEASLVDPLYALVGTWENTGARIRLADLTAVDAKAIRLEPERWYRIRVELDEGRLSIAIDGDLACAAEVGGWDVPRHVVLYGVGPGKRWRNLRIWQRGLPERLPATAIGDAFLRTIPAQPRQAAEHYRAAVELLSGRDAEDARLRQGVALAVAGETAAATQVWSGIANVGIAETAWSHGVRVFLADGHTESALAAWRRLAGSRTPQAQLAWSAMLRNGRRRLPEAVVAELRAVGEQLPRSYLVRETLGELLAAEQRWDAALPLLDGIQPQQAMALLSAGRPREVIDDPLAPSTLRIEALIQAGRLDEALAHRPLIPSAHAVALIAAGRAVEVATAAWADPPLRAMAALAMGDDETAAREGSEIGGVRGRALRRLGRLEERLREHPNDIDALLLAGRIEQAAKLLPLGGARHGLEVVRAVQVGQVPPAVGPADYHSPASVILCDVVVPALRTTVGDRDASRRLEEAAQDASGMRIRRSAPLARAVLGRDAGAISEGDRLLAAALRAEMAGDPRIRQRAWQAWLALPPHRRDPDDGVALLILAGVRATR